VLRSPAEFVERVRVAAACRLLAHGDEPITAVAGHVGFTSRETMRRAFMRRVGVPPGLYRRRAQHGSGASMAGSEGSLSLPRRRRDLTIETCTSCPQ
jgi:AraC-like DNA-binding protein